jgi:uncharacterized Fe-S cluster protein YjdI
MSQIVKRYTRGDVTVVWKPDQCIHSTLCWRGLVEVFNPRNKPWVNMDGADTDRIIEQVSKCPSGALSCVITTNETAADKTQTESTTAVEVLKNGPLMVYGNLAVKDSKGNEVSKSKVTAFCRCGASANKPFCDGSHIRIGFKDE